MDQQLISNVLVEVQCAVARLQAVMASEKEQPIIKQIQVRTDPEGRNTVINWVSLPEMIEVQVSVFRPFRKARSGNV